jgi:hypothetical protein
MGHRACIDRVHRRPHGIRRRRTVVDCYERLQFTPCAERLYRCVRHLGPPFALALFKGLDGELLVLHSRRVACGRKGMLAIAWPIRGKSVVSKRPPFWSIDSESFGHLPQYMAARRARHLAAL